MKETPELLESYVRRGKAAGKSRSWVEEYEALPWLFFRLDENARPRRTERDHWMQMS